VPGPDEVWSEVLSFLNSRPGRLLAQGTVLSAVATLAYAGFGHSLNFPGGDAVTTIDAGAAQQMFGPAPSLAPVPSLTPAGTPTVASSPSDSDAVAALRVVLTADGETQTVTTAADTVGELLAEQNLTLGDLDRLNLRSTTPLITGLKVKLVRVEKQQTIATEKVPFTTKRTRVGTLPAGTTKVITKGVAGQRRATYSITLADGRQISKHLLSAELVRQPVTAVIQEGPEKPASSGSDDSSSSTGTKADSLNWAALAKCESGGNPRATNPAGYYGLYQFSLSTWRAVGGSGNPRDASSAEQTKRAKMLYNKAGAGQWPVCGRKLFT